MSLLCFAQKCNTCVRVVVIAFTQTANCLGEDSDKALVFLGCLNDIVALVGMRFASS